MVSYMGGFEAEVDTQITVVFEADGGRYSYRGKLIKPANFRHPDPSVIYFLQENCDPNMLLMPIDDNATVYKGDSNKPSDMIGVVIKEEVRV